MLSCATKGKPSLAMYIDLAKTLLYCYLSSLIRHETVLFGAKLINQSALFPRLCSSNRDYSWKWFILQTWSWASPSWSTLPLTSKSLFAPTTVNKTELWAPRIQSPNENDISLLVPPKSLFCTLSCFASSGMAKNMFFSIRKISSVAPPWGTW